MTYSLLRNRSASELLSIAFVGAGSSDRHDCSITPLRGKRVQGFRMAGAMGSEFYRGGGVGDLDLRIQLAEHGVDALLKPGTFGFGIQWIDDFGGVFPKKDVDDIQLRGLQ